MTYHGYSDINQFVFIVHKLIIWALHDIWSPYNLWTDTNHATGIRNFLNLILTYVNIINTTASYKTIG